MSECRVLQDETASGLLCSCAPGVCALDLRATGPRREATCQCCHRNDAPHDAEVCTSCAAYAGYPVRLTKYEARVLQEGLTRQADYPELEPEFQALYDKLDAVR